MKLQTITKLILLVGALCCFQSISAQASLIGDTVHLEATQNGSAFISADALITDPGVEFLFKPSGSSLLSLDIFEDSFDIIFNLNGIGSLGVQTVWMLSDLDWLSTAGNIVGITQISGPTVDNITFGIDSIAITVPNLNSTIVPIHSMSFNIETTHHSVPEPTSFAIFGLGLAGIVLSKRRKLSNRS